MTINLNHLEQLLELRSKVRSYHLLSATRQRLMNELISADLVQFLQDESHLRDSLQITDRGTSLLRHIEATIYNYQGQPHETLTQNRK